MGKIDFSLLNESDYNKLMTIISQVEAIGELKIEEVCQFQEIGLPIISIISEYSGNTLKQVLVNIRNGDISFEQFKQCVSL